jgi:hypothetical protein
MDVESANLIFEILEYGDNEPIPGNSLSWSGYKMTWQEGSVTTEQNLVGVEGYLYIYTRQYVNDEELVLKCTCKGVFTKHSDVLYTCTDFEITSDNGAYDPDTMSEYVIKKWSIELMHMAADEEIGTEEGDYWVIYTNDYRPNTLSHACFFGSSAATPADVTDWSDTPYGDFSAAGGELPAFEMQEVTSGTPTGWHKADTLTEGLSIVGFTPSVGSVYNEDTTALVYLHPNQPTVEVIQTTATAGDILAGKTAVLNGELVTGTISTVTASKSSNTVTVPAGYIKTKQTITVGTSVSAKTYTPGTTDQTIAADSYISGVQTIKGDSNLIGANIKEGVSIFGVSGEYIGSSNSGGMVSGYTMEIDGNSVNMIPGTRLYNDMPIY